MTQQKSTDFIWHAPLEGWRDLILGSIGVASYACGGRADSAGDDSADPRAEGAVVNAGAGRGSVGSPAKPDEGGYASGATGGNVGPGGLPIEDALEETELGAILETTVCEGCIGETLAALEAAEALQHCEDPGTRAVLERIAADETRHAALAWKFVAWALSTGPFELRSTVREVFDEALDEAASAPAELDALDLELSRHGLLSPALRQALRPRVLREVVAPCAAALLAKLDSSPRSVAALRRSAAQ